MVHLFPPLTIDLCLEMSLDDLWTEWTETFSIDSVKWPPLKELELERRSNKRGVYFESHLETTIRRRRQIAEYAEITSLNHVKGIQTMLSGKSKKTCSLYNLWLHIRNESKKSS